jgi:sortase A
MSPKRKPDNNHSSQVSRVLSISGIVLIVLGILLTAAIFWPVLTNELAYQWQSKTAALGATKQQTHAIQPVDTTFGIVVPKIRANAAIVPNVDPYDANAYQLALTKGVAHAKGSVYPGRIGNVFIFSHSSVDFFKALQYNSVFYLLDKLDIDDEIILYFNSHAFVYRVMEKKIVEPNAAFYLTEKTEQKLVTLMTCWPPGTTFKRLIVRGILQEE